MAGEKKLGQCVLKCVRLSFPHLWEPTKSVEDGALKYRATALMDPNEEQGAANIAKIERILEQVKESIWKDKASKIKLKADRLCFKVGDEQTNQETQEVYMGYEGMMAIVASNKRKPQVVDNRKQPITEADDIIYGGCYVNMVVNIWGTKDADKGGNGIFATLEAIQKHPRKGEPFGAAPVNIDDVFDEEDDDYDGESGEDEV